MSDHGGLEIIDNVETEQALALRASEIRSALPRQRALLRGAVLTYGLPLAGREIKRRIAETLPARQRGHIFTSRRYAVCARVEDYRARIPDRALLVLQEAVETREFQSFCIMFPTYDRAKAIRECRAAQVDPWLIGWTSAEYSSLHDSNHQTSRAAGFHANDMGIVLAYWDDARIHPPQAQ